MVEIVAIGVALVCDWLFSTFFSFIKEVVGGFIVVAITVPFPGGIDITADVDVDVDIDVALIIIVILANSAIVLDFFVLE